MIDFESVVTRGARRAPPPDLSMLVVGASEMASGLRRVAAEAALRFVHKTSIVSAASWLEKALPAVVLIDLRSLLACDLFATLRKTPRWAMVPLIGLSTSPSELSFSQTFWSGGDDVANPLDADQLVARLQAMPLGERAKWLGTRGPGADEQRSAVRLPYGTMVRVRPSGAARDLVGYTHNISARGMFVRSLYPFSHGESVTIEIVPPCSERWVRLNARAAWRRPFAVPTPPLCPPGTGFEIFGGAAGAEEVYQTQVRALAESAGVPATSV